MTSGFRKNHVFEEFFLNLMYTIWWIANCTYHNGQFYGKDSIQQLHSCCFLDFYRPHLESTLQKEQVMSGMSDPTNNQIASTLTKIQQHNRQRSCWLSQRSWERLLDLQWYPWLLSSKNQWGHLESLNGVSTWGWAFG